MKSVGIITFHCSYNYGSALQAYALQSYLLEMGYKVKIIDYRSADFDGYKLFRLRQYKKRPQSLLADVLFLIPHSKRKRNFVQFWKDHLNLTQRTYNPGDNMAELNAQFDVFICGSDQIWNLDCTGEIDPVFFLGFAAEDKRKIAYAPSLGHIQFKRSNINALEPLIRRLDAISVREASTLALIQPYTEKQVNVTLDPTLLLPPSAYESIIPRRECKKKYIFVYMLENRDDTLIDYAHRLNEETGLDIYFIGYKYNCSIHGKNLYGISPSEFLFYLKNAQYVVTNSFHATVFSILFEKQFCTFKTLRSFARMQDLLTQLKLTQRIYTEGFEMEEPIDFCNAAHALAQMKQDSEAFLRNALAPDSDRESVRCIDDIL